MKKGSSAIDTNTIIIPMMVFVMALLMTATLVKGQTSNGTTLKIAVPIRDFDYGFVKANVSDNEYDGFAVEVFREINRNLPNEFSLQFVPFVISSRSFDDMLRDVSTQRFDGAVGDVSIDAYRTQWVDFTMPYMSSGVSMLVPLKQAAKVKSGIPLMKVTKGFVAATLAFSFIVAFAFWFMEQKNHKHASLNSHSSEIDHADWRREMIGAIIQTRLVMVLLFMVLLVLISCYSASQTSSLTINRSATVKNLNQLRRTGVKVGYQTGSFVKRLVIQKGLLESQLVEVNSKEEIIEELSKGPKHGGVAAVVAPTAYLKILQRQHCDEFTLVPTFNLLAAGFGFAFRKNLPQTDIVNQFSKGILDLMYNGEMGNIQDRTIGNLDTCEDEDENVGPTQLLDSDTQWILVAGAIGVILLMSIVFLVHASMTFRRNPRKKNAVAYPCYLFPCCK